MVAKAFIHHIKLVNIKLVIGQNIINAKCGGQAHKAAANAKVFFQKSILPVAADMKIGK